MRILIVGGGFAGLALAAHLRKYDHQLTLIDKTPEWKHIGFVIGMWNLGLQTLKDFHLETEIKKIAGQVNGFSIRKNDGTLLKTIDFSSLIRKYGLSASFMRADFHQLLLDLNKGLDIRLGMTVVNIDQSSELVKVTFNDRTQENYDLVVGADGIHSSVRELTFGSQYLQYSGMAGWIYMTPPTFEFPQETTEVWNGSRFFGVYPYNNESLCTIFGVKVPQTFTGLTENKIQFLRENFQSFGWIVPSILESMKNPDEVYFSLWSEVMLKQWVNGRVVVIGDAAHAMLPNAGMGASMALEDAQILAEELGKSSSSEVPQVLQRYYQRRQIRVNQIKRHFALLGSIKRIENPFLRVLRDTVIQMVPTNIILSYFQQSLQSKP